MSVKKTIQTICDEEFAIVRTGLNKLASDVCVRVDTAVGKLQQEKQSRLKSVLISVRNWLNHLILWVIFALLLSLLSSCFVAARTAYIETPFAKAAADTVTAVIGRAYKPLVDK